MDLPVLWFGKKDGASKASKSDSNGSVKKGKAPKKGKHQKKAPLSYTALEPFVDSLYGDNGFRYDDGSESRGVVLILPFSELGGLTTSKADKRDQSKGVLVTAINKGDFEVYYDENQDELEQLIILVNSDSIDTLADFSILKNAEFRWAYFGEDGEVEETDYVSTMSELIEHRTDLEGYFNSIFDEDEDNEVVESTQNNISHEPVVPEVTSELNDLSELDGLSIPETVEEPVFAQPEIRHEFSEPTPEVGIVGDDDGFYEEPDFGTNVNDVQNDYDVNEITPDYDEPQFDEYNESYSDEAYDDDSFDESLMIDENTVDDETVDTVVNQVLFSGDLDLNMPTDRFKEIYLMGANDYLIPYYDEDGSWLTSEVNHLIHSANDDIRRKITSDSDVAHAMYVRLLNDLAVKTSEAFDLTKENAYSTEMDTKKMVSDEAKNQVLQEFNDYEIQQREEYAKRREAKGDEAKANAMNVYDQQNSDKFERQLEENRRVRLNKVDSEYADSIVSIKDRRKRDAQVYFESGVAKVLAQLGEYYVAIREAQKGYANQWGDKIINFLDDNREVDIARVNVMKRQLDEDTRFAKVESESEAKIKSLTEEFNAQVELLKTSSARELENAQNLINTLNEEVQRLHNDLDKSSDRSSTEYKDLAEKYELAHKELIEARTKASMFELQQSQLNQRDREIENWKNQVEIISKANNQNKVAFFCVAVVAVIAAALIGMIAGAQLF